MHRNVSAPKLWIVIPVIGIVVGLSVFVAQMTMEGPAIIVMASDTTDVQDERSRDQSVTIPVEGTDSESADALAVESGKLNTLPSAFPPAGYEPRVEGDWAEVSRSLTRAVGGSDHVSQMGID